jgi:hypothetical protein
MSDKIISVSIDVTMLDKARFRAGSKPNKAGKIPQYVTLDVMLRRDGADQYGNNYYVKQSNYEKDKPKEDRAEMPIIGNGKTIVGPDGPQGGQTRRAPAPRTAAPKPASDDSSDVPF